MLFSTDITPVQSHASALFQGISPFMLSLFSFLRDGPKMSNPWHTQSKLKSKAVNDSCGFRIALNVTDEGKFLMPIQVSW